MARIRTIKPEFFQHEELFDLEIETGLPIRLAFAGLWTQCDREGRFKWRARSLKAQVLPFDECDFSRVLDALTTRGFIRKYTVDGREFGVVTRFKDHQVINNRESKSKIPEPPNPKHGNDLTREARVDHAGSEKLMHAQGERKGKEHGKEQDKNTLLVAASPDGGDSAKTSKAKFVFEPEDRELAEFMFSKIRRIEPTFSEPKFERWANEIRLMRTSDNRTREEIRSLFCWANADPFWQTNILSPKKLRQQWDQLTLKRKSGNAGRTGSRGPVNGPGQQYDPSAPDAEL